MSLDIAANRTAAKYGKGEQLRRVAWGCARLLFRASPRPCYGIRRWLLRRFGARLGRGVNVSPTALVYFPWLLEIGEYAAVGDAAMLYNLGPLRIGPRATISQRAHLCGGSHDYTDPAMPLLRLPITVEADAWVCADAFVGPGVTVGAGAVVGARAAAFKDVAPWTIVGGNPAKVIGRRELRSRTSAARGDD
jgi:putative colanic acid biosynthesis acetyltransferase WcaF